MMNSAYKNDLLPIVVVFFTFTAEDAAEDPRDGGAEAAGHVTDESADQPHQAEGYKEATQDYEDNGPGGERVIFHLLNLSHILVSLWPE